jgi:alanyl-tRNA synthetase
MDTVDVTGTFLDFYRDRGHAIVTGTTLIPPLLPPPGDPVLFTTSGMHPLTPYLEGRPHPLGRRLANVQRCLRTTDLDEVGDDTHLTLFEMLGSWSLGDYEIEQSLRWGYELLRDGYGVPHERLHATVFGGDDGTGGVPPDIESIETWRSLGVPTEQTRDENWWSNGPTGPCGPDSEIFVWTGTGTPQGTPTTDPRWVEVWNHVRMRYRRHGDGSLEPLRQHGIDTGMGVERMVTVLRGGRSVYDCDALQGWRQRLPWSLDERSTRIVCDHLRSAVTVIGDGVRPSNTGRGYVLRRLIRRALTALWRDDPSRSLSEVSSVAVLLEEERRFRALLDRGRSILSRYPGPLSEADYRYLHDTHGLPRDLVLSLHRDGGRDPARAEGSDR